MNGNNSSNSNGSVLNSDNVVEITPLGAGNEVGRSCIIASFRSKTIMFDCGIHPGYSGLMSLPFFDEVDLKSVDAILITHFHLDHCAALPYVLSKTDFGNNNNTDNSNSNNRKRGRVFMTHPTKAIYHTLLMDFVRLTKNTNISNNNINSKGDEGGLDADNAELYDEEDVNRSMDQIEVIDFNQTISLDDSNSVKITAYAAGHVLGAAMFLVEIGGCKMLYTGDYSRMPDRHLAAAAVPDINPHVVIIESTYGVSSHRPREEREERFLQTVRDIVLPGGRCLLPVVALGRAQELLLMLDEHWDQHAELRHIPIYQASGLASRAMSVYQTYIEFMNEDIKEAFQMKSNNPFVFKHVQHINNNNKSKSSNSNIMDDYSGACVILATPSMLQSGFSREIFDNLCENPINGVIIADFAVQGTLAREILSEPAFITTKKGLKVPLRCKVESISFSAHADFPQTRSFLDSLQPSSVVLVHGEMVEMGRLKRALEQKAAADGKQRMVHMPKNCHTIRIEVSVEKRAKVVGRLAENIHRKMSIMSDNTKTNDNAIKEEEKENSNVKQELINETFGDVNKSNDYENSRNRVQGVLVRKGFTDTILDPNELGSLTELTTSEIMQRQAIPINNKDNESKSTLSLEQLRLDLEIILYDVHENNNINTNKKDTSEKKESVHVKTNQDNPNSSIIIGDRIVVTFSRGSFADNNSKHKRKHNNNNSHSNNIETDFVLLEWPSSPENDILADVIVSCILKSQSPPIVLESAEHQLIRARQENNSELVAKMELVIIEQLLIAQFGKQSVQTTFNHDNNNDNDNDDETKNENKVKKEEKEKIISLQVDQSRAVIRLASADQLQKLQIDCEENDVLKLRLEKVMDNIYKAIRPVHL